MNIRPFIRAGKLRKTPNIKRSKAHGKVPKRGKHEYQRFWSGKVFPGDRVNDVRLTHVQKKK
jgi:hypothetical protein